ncbi:MAG TPA: hypothetical protein VK206_08780 [Anaerolineales bacterium]|nr:hypothetical protein [Anaerolineales bacterium]
MKRIHPALILLIIAILAYGLLIPQLGFYWDDFPISWIRYQLGPGALAKYFSTNRPVWGLLHQVTTLLLPQVPIYWQLLALLFRWLGAVVVWGIVKQLFPGREQLALGISLFFLLYPGFNQQWASYLYSHFFIVLFFFLYSIYLMLRRKTILALILSALNLWMMEYFFVLELARPFLIWTSLREESIHPRTRLTRTLKLWTPYLAVFALAVFSRLFIFNNQIYGFSIRAELVKAPLATTLLLIQNVLVSLWTVTGAAWAQIFQFPDFASDGPRTIALYAFIVLIVGALVLFVWRKQTDNIQTDKRELWWIVALGAVMIVLAGPPFWLTNVPVSLGFPANRATLSFMLGVSFMLGGLIEFIPWRVRYAIVTILVALAAGRQFLWANEFRRDWANQKNLFWQMNWRAPGIKPNTLVLMNEYLLFYADNSISVPLNWIYAADNHTDRVDYVLFYPTNRLDSSLLELKKDIPVKYDYLAGEFNGNTSQALAFYYDPPACLRLLEPDLDSINHFILDDSLMREASALSNEAMIIDQPTARMPEIYRPEPAHAQAWCYYFEKADLARQLGNWKEVTKLGDTAFKLEDHPNNPVERFVFIEGYAHMGDWERAIKLSRESYLVSKDYVGPLLCRLWQRIEMETTDGPERSAALSEVKTMFACKP